MPTFKVSDCIFEQGFKALLVHYKESDLICCHGLIQKKIFQWTCTPKVKVIFLLEYDDKKKFNTIKDAFIKKWMSKTCSTYELYWVRNSYDAKKVIGDISLRFKTYIVGEWPKRLSLMCYGITTCQIFAIEKVYKDCNKYCQGCMAMGHDKNSIHLLNETIKGHGSISKSLSVQIWRKFYLPNKKTNKKNKKTKN